MVKEYESPTPFWYWSGLSTLSAIAKDKVWVERSGNLQVYLNIYVLLFGRSGIRKGPPINLAKELVKKIGNTRVISGRSSVEAIVEDLKEVQTDQARKTILTDSCGFIVSSEFSSGIVRSEQALTTLTNLYDRRYNEGAFDIRLIRTGKQTLKSPTITMLGGINEAHFQSFMEDKDITGGFLGRTFVIHANEKNRINSLMFEMENKIDEEKLLEHLKLVEKLKGPLIISDAGKVTYNAWYNDFYSVNTEDKTGTHERIGDSALKIAGLLSLSNGISMEVNQKEIMTGIEMAEKLINSARHVTFTLHEEESLSTLKKKILKILVKRIDHKITARKLLADLHGVLNADDLVKIGETLQQGGLIDIYMFGDSVVYEMNKNIVEKLKHAIGEE
jgi:hypothetical protein